MKLNYKTKLYELTDNSSAMGSCRDCAFEELYECPYTDNSSALCMSESDTTNKIWKEVKIMNKQVMVLGEPRYTVEEVMTVCHSVLGYICPTALQIKQVAKYLKLQTDSEYKKYLDLKPKFEVNDD